MGYDASPASAEMSSSSSASLTRRCWSSSVRVLRVTFSVARTVRSATSRRISWIARRVSVSMSRRGCAGSRARLGLALLLGLALMRLGRPAGARDDFLGLLAGLLQALLVLGQDLVRLMADLL